ncbi:MAG: ATP-binding protein, partial [Acidobacteria bacterium]|nr:ATP-binding protein [Acidobacteriota bacterium]
GNAIKFTPEKGTIRVTVAGGPEGVTVAVADSGAGIPEEVRRRLFSPFITGRQKESGSGLGLAFCRLAVEAHKGRISAETTADRGTVFTFTLPAAEPARSSNEGGGLAPEPARHG